jgi:hypothetical protein
VGSRAGSTLFASPGLRRGFHSQHRGRRPILRSVITVIVPAHNEATVIGNLLAPLAAATTRDALDVIVVANGCTDDTAAVAASFGPPVRVISISEASKRAALTEGDQAARSFPRIYVDADVVLGSDDVSALAEALSAPGVLAAGPERRLEVTGRPLLVRWYYDIWQRLPEVQQGLFGRGVIALTKEGHTRIGQLPPLQADDLAVSLAFAPAERAVVTGARSVIQAPWTMKDLLRRRIRVATGVMQVVKTEGAPPSSANTRTSDLTALLRREPLLAPRIVLFLAVAVFARAGAKRAVDRGDYATWLRDESTRSGAPKYSRPSDDR